jgi:hypothetical protein
MAAIRSLCRRVLFLAGGKVVLDADPDVGVEAYLDQGKLSKGLIQWPDDGTLKTQGVYFRKAYIEALDGSITAELDFKEPFTLVIEYQVLKEMREIRTGFLLTASDGTVMCNSSSYGASKVGHDQPGQYISRCRFPGHIFNSGTYSFTLGADVPPYVDTQVRFENCLTFTIVDNDGHGPGCVRLPGVIRPRLLWEVVNDP